MKLINLLLLLFFLPVPMLAGEWQFFPFADQYRRVECAGDEVFLLMGNRLIQANGPQWSFERELNRQNGLSENEIEDIAYSAFANKLAIVYRNGMIDILHSDGTFTSLADLKETPFGGQSKHINHVAEGEGMLCISTDFGFLVVDMKKEVIKDCLTLGTIVTNTWVEDSHYFYHTQDGKTFTCRITANLFNPNNWTTTSATPPQPSIPQDAIDCSISITGDTIYTLYPSRGLISNYHSDALEVVQLQQGNTNNRLFINQDLVSTCHVSDLRFTDYVTMVKTQGYLSEYSTSTNSWANTGANSIVNGLSDHKTFGGIMDMVPDPATPHRYYYSTIENGIYIVQDGQLEARWDVFDGTSHVEAFAGTTSRVGGLALSEQGDLWYLNEGMDEILRVSTHDGQWYKFVVDGAAGQVSMPHLLHSHRPDSHLLWGIRTHGYQKCIIFAYDYAGTLDNPADDRSVTIQKFTDADGHTIHPYYFNNIVEGPDGSIWILTTQGIYVIDEPEQVFDHPGLVRCAFDGLIANDLVFDSERRIWIATQDNGVFLYDPTGTKVLEHFTTDNCQLTSNEVLAIAFDAKHNTVWISCIGSLLSFQYDESKYEAGSASSAYCYPTSVLANDASPINIVGLQDHSTVNVRNEAGYVVLVATAIGGTVTLQTNQMAKGKYDVVGTDQQGQYGLIGSFSIE